MLKNDTTTIDNFTLQLFKEGEEYDVRESTGCRLVQRGSAKSLERYHPAIEAMDARLEAIRVKNGWGQ